MDETIAAAMSAAGLKVNRTTTKFTGRLTWVYL